MIVAIISVGADIDGAADGFLKRKEDKNEWRAFVRFIAAASFEKEARFLFKAKSANHRTSAFSFCAHQKFSITW